ncbi:MAG: 3-hydroxyacyl-CoA dehydrogenase family protein, partial [Thermoanaerobaculia bacterium]|nr:3-hydroxyacyl-CoA dehydrogenase family protein [Thermoanaerobaculia bacterium]
RCLLPMVLEGAKILDEGIASRGSDIDVIWVNGYGWPLYRGGPMYWADAGGLDRVVARCDELERELGEAWRVPELLRRTATAGGRLSET